jgi:two-component system LytT family response regulator
MNPPLSVLVVDDERPARARVIRFLSEDARFKVVGEAQDGVEALEQFENVAPDIVVLDIQMPGLDGFEVLAALGEDASCAVVFSTAFDAHALRAFEAHAVDYLLKPYPKERLEKAMDKAFAQCVHASRAERAESLRGLAPRLAGPPRLTIKTVHGPWVVIPAADILGLRSDGKYTRIRAHSGEYVARAPIRDVAKRLEGSVAQIHRSEYVSLSAVRRVEPWTHGDAILVLADESTSVLTRTYREAFFEQLTLRTGGL